MLPYLLIALCVLAVILPAPKPLTALAGFVSVVVLIYLLSSTAHGATLTPARQLAADPMYGVLAPFVAFIGAAVFTLGALVHVFRWDNERDIGQPVMVVGGCALAVSVAMWSL